jgi:hypothetical protein
VIDYASYLHADGRDKTEDLDSEPVSLRLRAEVRRYGYRNVARVLGISERWLRQHVANAPPELEDMILAEKGARGQP